MFISPLTTVFHTVFCKTAKPSLHVCSWADRIVDSFNDFQPFVLVRQSAALLVSTFTTGSLIILVTSVQGSHKHKWHSQYSGYILQYHEKSREMTIETVLHSSCRKGRHPFCLPPSTQPFSSFFLPLILSSLSPSFISGTHPPPKHYLIKTGTTTNPISKVELTVTSNAGLCHHSRITLFSYSIWKLIGLRN